jgi:hypothetical protein
MMTGASATANHGRSGGWNRPARSAPFACDVSAPLVLILIGYVCAAVLFLVILLRAMQISRGGRRE